MYRMISRLTLSICGPLLSHPVYSCTRYGCTYEKERNFWAALNKDEQQSDPSRRNTGNWSEE
eukprot:COSAG01_NODE_1557_length_9928_cov_7.869977_1_plen_61_part_10